MPEIVQEIGAYAGLASVLGLAVLSALYFSQARDVRRLREWAGRAPERSEQAQAPVPGRAGALPAAAPAVSRPAAPAVPGQAAAATGARPAAATAAATRAGQPVPAGVGAQASVQTPPKPGPPVPPAAPKPPVPAPAGAGNSAPKPATPAGARPAPPVPAPTAGKPGKPAKPSQPTVILPPPGKPPWYRRLLANPLYLVLTIAGVLILGGAAVFGVTQLSSDDGGETPAAQEPAGSSSEPASDSGDDEEQQDKPRKQGAAIDPASVTVAVLNGTTVPGLAATLSDQVGAAGFTVGTIANFGPNQQLAESVVQYAAGHEREAAAVGRKLGIGQREPASAESQELAGDSTVIVIAGADKAP